MKHKPNSTHSPAGRDEVHDVSTAKAAATGPEGDPPIADDMGDPPPDPASSSSADRVGELEAEVASQKDRFLRLAAEYDNFRKRTVRERQDAESRGMGILIRGLLDPLDDLGRFAHVDPATVDAATIVQGADMVEKKVFKTLAGHGLEVLDPTGQPFDPAVHEAISTMRAELPEQDHFIAQVYQVGYTFNGQLLRPARVVVMQWHGEP